MIVYHHLGLGDHLICYGLVRELKPDFLLCKKINLPTVEYMYQDTGITVVGVEDDKEAAEIIFDTPHIKIGFTDATMTEEKFGEEFYRQAGVDYNKRWAYEIKKPCPQISGAGNFIHIPFLRQRVLGLHGVTPEYNISKNIFGYRNIIENAPEVHVMESSFRQMIEFLEPKGILTLHFDKEKSWRIVPSKHQWKIIDLNIR